MKRARTIQGGVAPGGKCSLATGVLRPVIAALALTTALASAPIAARAAQPTIGGHTPDDPDLVITDMTVNQCVEFAEAQTRETLRVLLLVQDMIGAAKKQEDNILQECLEEKARHLRIILTALREAEIKIREAAALDRDLGVYGSMDRILTASTLTEGLREEADACISGVDPIYAKAWRTTGPETDETVYDSDPEEYPRGPEVSPFH